MPDEYADLVAEFRRVQDLVTGSQAPVPALEKATAGLREAAAALTAHQAPDGKQAAGFRIDLPGRGHPALPPFLMDVMADDRMEGRVTFTRSHLSGGGYAHAGILGLLFGEVLGVLSVLGGRLPARNAALHVNYRAATPSEVELRLVATVTGVEGRKIHVQGELRHGDLLLADAEGLYLKLRVDEITTSPE